MVPERLDPNYSRPYFDAKNKESPVVGIPICEVVMVDGKKICMPRSGHDKSPDEAIVVNRWMTLQEACVYLVCHERTLRKFVSQGKVKSYKLGHSYRFRLRDLDASLERVSQTETHNPSLDGFIASMADVRRAG